MSTYRPLTPDALVAHCATRFARISGIAVVGIEGADAAGPFALATAVAEAVRTDGRAADVVAVHDFIRPASQRLEWGARDEEAFQTSWYDYAAIRREVVDAAHRHRRWLPRLWDADSDRSFRDEPRTATDDQLLIVAGPMLARDVLDLDLRVSLRMSRAALERRTPETERWTIGPVLDFDATAPDADIEVRYDHPNRPAIRIDRDDP